MRERWLSRRALQLHAAVLFWVPACLVAFWWQVNRAFGGNGLSYVYSVEWPVFALLGIWAWWVLVHADPERAGARGQRRLARQLATSSASPEATGPGTGHPGATGPAGAGKVRRTEEEDDELAAYNDRLAALAQRGPKTWRNT